MKQFMKKLITRSFLVLLSNVLSISAQVLPNSVPTDQLGMMKFSLQIRKGYQSVLNAIDNFQTGNEQPPCMDPIHSYVFCAQVFDDIDDFTFFVHPLVQPGTTIGSLSGTSDYAMGKGMAQSIVNTIDLNDCEDVDKFGLATFGWLSSQDMKSPVMVTTVVKSFAIGDDVYICSSGPVLETESIDGEELIDDVPTEIDPEPDTEVPDVSESETETPENNTTDVAEDDVTDETDAGNEVPIIADDDFIEQGFSVFDPKLNMLIPEFVWDDAPPGLDYDYSGTIEMCGGDATKMVWPDYFLYGLATNTVFGYRQVINNMSNRPCGREMAPLLRFQAGKTYKINFINNSKSPSNFHCHGMHIGGDGQMNDFTREIAPGMCGEYIWRIPANHQSGMHWYHPHAHYYTFEQVRGRAFGPIFIDEPKERLASYPASIQKWLANEVLVQISIETVPSPILNGDGVKDGRCSGGYAACYPRANNKRKQVFTFVKDEWYSLNLNFVVPGGTDHDVFKFFDKDGKGEADCTTMIAGYDGVYRSKVPRPVEDYPEQPNLFHFNGGTRIQLAIKCNSDATMKVGKKESKIYLYSVQDPEVPVLIQINVVDGEKTEASPYADESSLTQWEPPRPQYLQDLQKYSGETEKWRLFSKILGVDSFDYSQIKPVFNGIVYDGSPSKNSTFEAVQEWDFYGTAAAPSGHPLHVHVNHMQIIGLANSSDCGPNFEVGEWVDTVRINDQKNDPCKVRFRVNDYGGKIMIHCNDFMHSDAGMMGVVQVQGGPDTPEATQLVPSDQCMNV